MLPMIARRWTDPFEALSRDFNRLLSHYNDAEVPGALAPYAVDVHEDADHYYVEAELPGFTKEEVDVTLENGILTLHAERKEETTGKKGEPLHTERRWTRFERNFNLPTAVNENAVKAELSNGLLKVTLDKREEVKPRKIQISDGSKAATNGGSVKPA